MRVFLLSAVALLVAVRAPAQAAERLFVRPWIELEPVARIEPGAYPVPLETAERSLLDDARQLISAMVYGWSFRYIPGDTSRSVAEQFVLTPLAEIPFGSPRLRVTETEVSDHETRLWARVLYTLNDDEARRRASWQSTTAAMSTGEGKASVIKGTGGRRASLEDAVRQAIQLGLHSRYLNTPREVSGVVVLWDDPQTRIGSGSYTTVATVKFLLSEIVPYRIF